MLIVGRFIFVKRVVVRNFRVSLVGIKLGMCKVVKLCIVVRFMKNVKIRIGMYLSIDYFFV